MQVSVEKPGSPSDILEHVGVRGMKWGVRKAADTAFGTKTSGRKPSSYKSKATRAKNNARRKHFIKKAVVLAAVSLVLYQNGKSPVSSLSRSSTMNNGRVAVGKLEMKQTLSDIRNLPEFKG